MLAKLKIDYIGSSEAKESDLGHFEPLKSPGVTSTSSSTLTAFTEGETSQSNFSMEENNETSSADKIEGNASSFFSASSLQLDAGGDREKCNTLKDEDDQSAHRKIVNLDAGQSGVPSLYSMPSNYSGYEYYQSMYDPAMYHPQTHEVYQQQSPMPNGSSSVSYASYVPPGHIDVSMMPTSSTASQYYYPSSLSLSSSESKTILMPDGSIVYHHPLQQIDCNASASGGHYASHNNCYNASQTTKMADTSESGNASSDYSLFHSSHQAKDWNRSVICFANGQQQQQSYKLEDNLSRIAQLEEQRYAPYGQIEPSEESKENNDLSPGVEATSMSNNTMHLINSRYTHERFPIKLWNLASDPSFTPIGWSSDGLSLMIDEELLEPVLGHYFRSKKYSSFLRQLHLYGFRKVTRARLHRPASFHSLGQSSNDRYDFIAEYQCTDFRRDRLDLVKNVRRFYQCQIDR